MNSRKKGAIADQHHIADAANQTQPRRHNCASLRRFLALSTAVLAFMYLVNKWAAKAEVTQYWTRLSWLLFNWLTHPWWVVVPLLVVVVLPFLTDLPRQPGQVSRLIATSFLGHSLNWRGWISRGAAIALLAYLILISPTLSSLAVAGLTRFVPADSGAKADAIVVLSRGKQRGERYEIAAQLWQDQRAPHIFVTAYGNVMNMKQLLQQQQLPIEILSGTDCAMTTYDEATSTAAILGPQGVESIILITDPPHMWRSLLTFRGFGFTVTPYMAPLPDQLSSAERSLLALREYPGLLSYAILGRFSPQPAGSLKQPSPTTLETMKQRKCQVNLTRH
jgi:uncharacterized SAM-binding protein YcdF (DUF218 family)